VTASRGALLTLFTIPKNFSGHVGVIQRNAIRSWIHLGSQVDVVLCGDEEGVPETARELGVRHAPAVERNEYGTPILSSVFEAVRASSSTRLLAYVNADIILFRDFVAAAVQLPDMGLMVGRRWDADVFEQLEFDREWERSLRGAVESHGVRAPSLWIDYFIFSRDSPLVNLPPFAVGRPHWDNWMIYRARSLGVPVVDATPSVFAVHQNHDYSHVPLRSGERWSGPEADINAALAGAVPLMSIDHATHVLTSRGITRAMTIRYLSARWQTRRAVDGGFEKFARAVAPLVVPPVRLFRLLRNRVPA
jgi:hypothetical protein